MRARAGCARRGVGPGCDGRRLGPHVRDVRRERRGGGQDHEHRGGEGEAPAMRRERDERAEDAAARPRRVERRHERAPVTVLDGDGPHVAPGVDQAEAQAIRSHRRRQCADAVREVDVRQRDDNGGEADAQAARRAAARGEELPRHRTEPPRTARARWGQAATAGAHSSPLRRFTQQAPS